MMLYPPMSELINKVGSSYALINLIAKRAREISNEPDSGSSSKKPVSAAIDEIYSGKVTVYQEPPAKEKSPEDLQLEQDLMEYMATLPQTEGEETEAETDAEAEAEAETEIPQVPEIILTEEDLHD